MKQTRRTIFVYRPVETTMGRLKVGDIFSMLPAGKGDNVRVKERYVVTSRAKQVKGEERGVLAVGACQLIKAPITRGDS